ncbi:MAG: hypothetical protein FGM33_02525 [Candidatus Kapabacteria bacterium]|nr:hypothetical protein [Candidatus Kapabacteria bacterium]
MSSRRSPAQLGRLLMLVLAAVGGTLLTSCSWSHFTMQDPFAYPIRTVVLTRPNTVKRTFENGFDIKGPARIGMRAERVTHGVFSTEIIRRSASPLTIQTRTTPYDDSVMSDRGIVITIAGDSTVVEYDGRRDVVSTNAPIGKPFVLEIKNLGHVMTLRVHHTECGTFFTRRHCTEWLIVSVPDASNIFVGDPWFATVI